MPAASGHALNLHEIAIYRTLIGQAAHDAACHTREWGAGGALLAAQHYSGHSILMHQHSPYDSSRARPLAVCTLISAAIILFNRPQPLVQREYHPHELRQLQAHVALTTLECFKPRRRLGL